MNSQSRLIQVGVWSVLGMVILSIAGVFVSTYLRQKPRSLPVYGTISDFQLTNQLGQLVTRADLQGHIWIADIIFTRCGGPCLEMSRKMKAIQASLPNKSPIKLLSLTADPTFDTPEVLRVYANRLNADPAIWTFLTGPKPGVYDLAIHGLKLAVQENTDKPAEGDQFIHSTRLVLVDQAGQVRGTSFDSSEAQAIQDVLVAAEQLRKEQSL